MAQRRPERSRTLQPLPGAPAHSNSSSSISSTRADRITRSNNRQQSSNKSSTPHSLSSDDGDDPVPRNPHSEPPQTRRRTRQQETGDDNAKFEDDVEDEITEEEEVTRCICGSQDYPGPPSDLGKSRDSQLYALSAVDLAGDEAGGLFIQCDLCKVWQHGGCVGIMDEAASPDEYYCEECKPQLHRITMSPQGQKYSFYLPAQKKSISKVTTQKASIPKEMDDRSGKDQDKMSGAAAEALKKRRSTMNSRAAVDDDEVLREVIEESKTDAGTTGADDDDSTRKAKRARDDSEESRTEQKRPRTGSRSAISSPTLESEEESLLSKSNGKSRPRGAAAKSQREKELREKEREREKAEAANKRKGRAERRRGDDLESLLEDAPVALEDSNQPGELSESQPPETPAVGGPTAPPKKVGKLAQKRMNRTGKNQYTRDNPATNAPNSPTLADYLPHSPQNRSTGHDNNGQGNDNQSHKHHKSKNSKLEKTSWNEIRKPAAVMLQYIQQRQLEMAERGVHLLSAESLQTTPAGANSTERFRGRDGIHYKPGEIDDDQLAEFKTLSSVEMMDHLSRDLELWHQTVKDF